MSVYLVRHVLRRATRSLWENLYLHSVAIGVIAAALLLMGVYLTVQHNVNRIIDTWGRDVHISAYFQPDVPEARRFSLRDQLAQDERVADVRYVSEADAKAWLAQNVDGMEGILDGLDPDVLPASLEIKLANASLQPHSIATFAQGLEGPDFSDIDYGQEWIERFNSFLALLKLLGAILGTLILLAALFLVMNTVHLVVYSRKDELETEKLVGATASFIVTPFLVEGLIEGLLGSLIAIVGLWGVHQLLVLRLQDALHLGVAGELQFLPASWLGLLASTGVILGVGAAMVAVQRFLAQAP